MCVSYLYNVMQRAFLNIQNRWIFLKLSVLVTHIFTMKIYNAAPAAHTEVSRLIYLPDRPLILILQIERWEWGRASVINPYAQPQMRNFYITL